MKWIIDKEDPPGWTVMFISDEMGKGVFSEKAYSKGDFLFEYPGEIKTSNEVADQDQTYIFHFRDNGMNLC